jgi:hypothetical protein
MASNIDRSNLSREERRKLPPRHNFKVRRDAAKAGILGHHLLEDACAGLRGNSTAIVLGYTKNRNGERIKQLSALRVTVMEREDLTGINHFGGYIDRAAMVVYTKPNGEEVEFPVVYDEKREFYVRKMEFKETE